MLNFKKFLKNQVNNDLRLGKVPSSIHLLEAFHDEYTWVVVCCSLNDCKYKFHVRIICKCIKYYQSNFLKSIEGTLIIKN